MKKKLVFISNIAAPYQIRFAEAINKYSDWTVKFLFCDSISGDRGKYWEMPLPSSSGLMYPVFFKKSERYLNPRVFFFLNKEKPDVVLLGGGILIPTVLLSYIWALFKKKKILFGPMELIPSRNVFKRVLRETVMKILFKKASGILCVGKRSMDYYGKFIDKEKIVNFTYAADIEEFLKHDVRKPGEVLTFLYSGRLIKMHQPDLLLRVFGELQKEYTNIKLCISAYGILKKKCLEIIEKENIPPEAVEWEDDLKNWDQIKEVYQNSDVLVFPTAFCGWGLVVLEAMASGMGIVCTRSAIAGEELILHEQNGFLVDNSAEEIKKYMRTYILNPALISQHGIQGKKMARQLTYNHKAIELINKTDFLTN